MLSAPHNQCVAAEGGETLVMHLRRFVSAIQLQVETVL
jgi:hypothetical protein